MRRTQILSACWLLVALIALTALVALPRPAAAQDDLRGIVPYIMLVVDTSGSMERQATCTCTSASCAECLPRCNLPNNPLTGEVPAEKKNRWAVTLEALTGTFNNFECEPIERSIENGMTYDSSFTVPYHQPWRCAGGTAGPCAWDAGAVISQNNNGILDLNVSGIRFGLMTFDGVRSYGRDEQRAPADFDDARSEGIEGMWSYGGKKAYRYPGCPHEYVMDAGARSSVALEGALVSLESCSGPGPRGTPGCESWCNACPGTQDTVNRDIQEALLATRPYGSTPIAASLDDLYYHFKDDLSDQFRSCRDRFAILITDGRPDNDFRSNNCDCSEPGSGKNNCAGLLLPTESPGDMRCPYPTPEQAAMDLVQGRGSDGPMLERLYVLGLAVSDDEVARQRIEDIADNGCTETDEECEIGETGSPAIFADNLDTLRQAVQVIVNENSHTVSRTTPVFALSEDPSTPQYMFSSALRLPTQSDQPWLGILERRRFVCGSGGAGSGDFVDLSAAENDLFHEELNSQSGRVLYTAYPSSLGINREGVLVRDGNTCPISGCPMRDFGGVSPSELQVLLQTSSPAESTVVVDWMYGKTQSRDDAALGAIYHSTPAISGTPRYDTSDPIYNQWRRQPRIAQRPQVLYVGTTDGVLHAFSTGDFNNPGQVGWRDLRAGEELWGFIPPMLLNDLRANMTTQQFLMDATPVIRTVNINRGGSNPIDNYRTILTMGMREGGNAYFALDITDPFNPQFLWQISGGTIGKTYGSPGIVQARFKPTPTSAAKDGAIAILPGGVGQRSTGNPACDGGSTQSLRTPGGSPYETRVPQPSGTMQTARHRFDVRCWTPLGRSLTFIDVEDGRLLKEIYLESTGRTSWSDPLPAVTSSNQPYFPSPLVSAPSPYPDEIGLPATRVFLTDADGVIWRVDLRSDDVIPSDPRDGWVARPFHDIFWDRDYTQGELSYEQPTLSVDELGRPVVLVGTGDTASFTKPLIENRIVSVTESPLQTTPGAYEALLNWELRVKDGTIDTQHTDGTDVTVDGLAASELVTGPMGLFEGQLFAGTFIAVANTDNVCDLGRGRLFALDYNRPDWRDRNAPIGQTVTYGPLRVNAADPENPDESLVNILRTDDVGDNVKISGISLVQLPSCTDSSLAYQDPWSGSWSAPAQGAPPQLYMMAHADDDNKDPSDTVDQRKNSSISTVEMRLKPPIRFSRVMSWAGSAD